MIPLRLSMRNFMCYRDPPPLDLRGLRVVCLAGRNGHGKSALLDAITWALWGGARGEVYGVSGRSHDALVHQGQAEMWVDLEFEVIGKGRFRVHRRYARALRGRNPASELHLWSVVGEDTIRSLDGNSLRETQDQIVKIVGMDYETFIHTAFLLQNGADRLMQVSPAERKRVLGEVLGISYYGRLRERVREMLQRLRLGDEEEPGIQGLRGRLADLEARASARPEWERALARAQARVEALTERLQALQAEREALQARRQALARLEEQARQAEALARQAREEAREFRAEAEALARWRAEAEALLARAGEVESAYERWRSARARRQALDEAGDRWQALQGRRADLERALASARARLEAQREALRREVEEQERLAGQAPALEARLTALEGQRQALEEEEERLQGERGALQEKEARVQALRQEQERLRQEMHDLRRRLDLLRFAPEPVCPLCGHPLGEEGMAHLQAELEREGRERRARHDEAGETARRLAQEVEAGRRALEGRERALRQRRSALDQETARLRRDLDLARQARERVQVLRADLQALEERLRTGEEDPALRSALAEVESALAEVGYDPAVHRAVRREEQELEWAEGEHRRLEEVRSQWREREEALERALERARRREETARQAEAEAERLRRDLEGLPDLLVRISQVEAEEAGLRQERDEALKEVRGAELRLLEAQEAEREAQEVRRRLQDLEREEQAWLLLERAFSPTGVPVRLIDAAIPMLEREANLLLARLTGGRMSLRLQTQREKRTGGVLETLDLLVADEWGTRPYELFSGGEAFRINFALRVALSRLLARRRLGAPLPILFVDEGFGTQDAEGRERIIDALRAIQDDFELVVVITHIEELRELFPARVEVEKTPQGSVYSVTWE